MRRTFTRTVIGLAATALAGAAAAASAGNPMVGGAAMYSTRNIVENAVNSKDHTTLIAAVKAAGLVDTLASPGPFTVFAPTDAAFAEIGITPDNVDETIDALGADAVRDIVLFHVAHGARSSGDVVEATKIRMLDGEFARVSVSTDPLRVTVGGAELNLGLLDIRASNGVIHVTNDVLLPPA